MAGKSIQNAHISRLDKFGEDVIFDDIAEGMKSKLRIDARKFMASKLDPSVYGDQQRGPLVNITVGSTHLNAIKDLATSPVTIDQIDEE